jgi:uncharacterized membrane protein YeaQ/YmgE (transglycosylase-associated protein family)
MSKVLMFLGLPYMDTLTMVVVLGLAFSAAVISGWLADVIMGQNSFGIAMNGVVMVIGAIIGLFLLKYSGFQYRASFLVVAMTCASISAVVLLLLFAFLRRYI